MAGSRQSRAGARRESSQSSATSPIARRDSKRRTEAGRRISGTAAKVTGDANDAGSRRRKSKEEDRGTNSAAEGSARKTAPSRAPTNKKLAERQGMEPTKLIQSLTSKWSRYTEAMVVRLIESEEEDVHGKLQEPWDAAYVEYGQTVGATALHFAARRGLLDAIRSLIEHKAPVNGATDTGATPIMVAATFSQVEAAQLLFEAKGSVLATDRNGYCAMDLALLEGSPDVITAVEKMEIEEDKSREHAVKLSDDDGKDINGDSEPDIEKLLKEQETITGKKSFFAAPATVKGGRKASFEPAGTDGPHDLPRHSAVVNQAMHTRNPGVRTTAPVAPISHHRGRRSEGNASDSSEAEFAHQGTGP